MKKRSLPNDVTRFAQKYYTGWGTPFASKAAEMLAACDWMGLAKLSVDPRGYTDAYSYFSDAAVAGFLRKNEDLPVSRETRKRATIDKWWESEKKCFVANQRLSGYLPENSLFAEGQEPRITAFFRDVRKKITSWIGPRPPALCAGRFGPGSTYSDPSEHSTIPHKMSSTPSLTHHAMWYLPQWYGTQWGSSLAHRGGQVQFVPGNRFTTVTKTALIDRGIAIEPAINVFYQLGLGRDLRRRLRWNTGWDLRTAQEVHRRVACASSVSREKCTLDLTDASNMLGRVLVKLCLPTEWHTALEDLRSPRTLIEGKWVVLEKFSSMGNGYTFELETIIFAAISSVVLDGLGRASQLGTDLFVFGDDIIVADDAAPAVVAALRFCGLELNEEKSFTGAVPFRESCGGDYFMGQSVRPYFFKKLPDGPQDYIVIANGINRVTEQVRALQHCPDLGAWFSVLDCLPSHVRRCRGPKALGDAVIHDDREELWQTRWRNSIRYIRSYRPHKLKVWKFERFDADIVLACATYGTGNRQGGVIPRDGVLSYKVGVIPFS